MPKIAVTDYPHGDEASSHLECRCGFVAKDDRAFYAHMTDVHCEIAIGEGFWNRADVADLVPLLAKRKGREAP
jgi:hypothetical protein